MRCFGECEASKVSKYLSEIQVSFAFIVRIRGGEVGHCSPTRWSILAYYVLDGQTSEAILKYSLFVQHLYFLEPIEE